MILMFSTIICLREFVALVISEIEAFDCTQFPAVEVMETLDKAKCVVFIGSTMGGMKGWMVPNYSTSTACATSSFCTLNSANHIIKAKADLMLCGGSD
ncbi:3-oxoacyl-[acyl-carrier-protein] synthase II, chloroplastic-like [Malus domestica]|uniref:3-oxoacyl-[acyl-carrier-protein] synthase II, chloroplastic-like n=1 Tax=Malus domestica TaxID=3750 RepID=UPI0010AA3019|nr:3-oxoacyl-[acyl-carrier-protein] synthase II, chloroplastic-like [Malus domestica]